MEEMERVIKMDRQTTENRILSLRAQVQASELLAERLREANEELKAEIGRLHEQLTDWKARQDWLRGVDG